MIVAIIDDGICKEEISTVVEVCLTGKINSDFRQTDHESHGTVCAKIIEKYSLPDKIIDIPFLDGHDTADLSDMCDALECCLDLNVDIINLSCGSAFFNPNTKDYSRLYNICRMLYYRKVKIFAAQNNRGNLTIPAWFPYVTSVERSGRLKHEITSLYRKSDILAESVHSIVLNGEKTKTEACNSYACAYATACEIAGKSDGIKISDTINSALSSYDVKAVSDNIYELYLDEMPKAVGRLYFHEISESEQKYLKINKMRSLLLSDNTEDIWNIEKLGKLCEKTDVPFIYIENNEQAIEIALELNLVFLNNMYKSCIVSSNMRDSVYDAIYTPDKCIDSFAKLFAEYNSCNVVIIICSFSQEKNNDDVYISFNNGITMMWDNKEKNIKETDDLYDEIIKLL